MSVIWELPQGDSPGSLQSLGRQLRRRYGDTDDMVADRGIADLIERLYAIPDGRPGRGRR